MRTLTDLVNEKKDVWVYLDSDELAEDFIRQAVSEGFIYPDGTTPKNANGNRLYGIHIDKRIAHLAMFIWVDSFAGVFSNEPPFRVDYRKYIDDEEDYECKEAYVKRVY